MNLLCIYFYASHISFSRRLCLLTHRKLFFVLFLEKLFQFSVTCQVPCVSLFCWVFIRDHHLLKEEVESNTEQRENQKCDLRQSCGKLEYVCLTKVVLYWPHLDIDVGYPGKATSLSKRRWVSRAGTDGEADSCVNQCFLEHRPVFQWAY